MASPPVVTPGGVTGLNITKYQRGWQDANDAGQAETNQRAQNAHAHKNGEERLLGLPAVRIATAVEMRSQHTGQLRV